MRDPIQDIAHQLGIRTFGDGLLTKIRETIDLLQSDANNLMQYKEVAAYLEAELAATVKDSLTVWKAQMARDSAELRRLCAERDKLKAKAVVPGWMTTPEAFAERAYHAGWRDIADAQHEGIAVMYDELFASAPAQPQSDGVMDGLVDAVKDVLDHLNDGHSIHSGTGLHSCLQAAYRALLGGEA